MRPSCSLVRLTTNRCFGVLNSTLLDCFTHRYEIIEISNDSDRFKKRG